MKKKEKDGLESYYQFNAIIESSSSDPRNTSILNKQIWLGCTMRYRL